MVRYGDNSSNVQTQFNSSLIRLFTLNDLLNDASTYSRLAYINTDIKNLKIWKSTLIEIFTLIIPKLKPEEKEKVYKKFKEARTIGKIYEIVNTEEGVTPVVNRRKFQMYWNLFHHIECELNILADKKGMLLVNKNLDQDFISDMGD